MLLEGPAPAPAAFCGEELGWVERAMNYLPTTASKRLRRDTAQAAGAMCAVVVVARSAWSSPPCRQSRFLRGRWSRWLETGVTPTEGVFREDGNDDVCASHSGL